MDRRTGRLSSGNVSIDAENFEQGVILVEQSEDHLPIYTDTIFTTIPQDGFTVYPGTWYNGIFVGYETNMDKQ